MMVCLPVFMSAPKIMLMGDTLSVSVSVRVSNNAVFFGGEGVFTSVDIKAKGNDVGEYCACQCKCEGQR